MPHSSASLDGYDLHAQVGFLLRRATQRHLGLFAAHIPDLTPTQFAALAQLCRLGPVSQNALGRATAMDGATIKGVVDRLRDRGFVASELDPTDQRRLLLRPTPAGRAACSAVIPAAHAITAATLDPLTPDEQVQFLALLTRLG